MMMIWLILYLIGVFVSLVVIAVTTATNDTFRSVLVSVVWPFLVIFLLITVIAGHYEKKKNMGEVSDGYHTFNELYEYRLLYNAAFFNELARKEAYDVHKSKRHSDGAIPFEDPNWFIVMAELPTGQISNHYEMKDWDLFQIPEKYVANKWDGHSPHDVAERIRRYLLQKLEL